jgi:hypothetical protein
MFSNRNYKPKNKIMNCDCIKEVESGLIGKPLNGKEIVEAEMVAVGFSGPKMEVKTYSEVEILYKGHTRKKKIPVHHNFCPFCGISLTDSKKNIKVPESVNVKHF